MAIFVFSATNCETRQDQCAGSSNQLHGGHCTQVACMRCLSEAFLPAIKPLFRSISGASFRKQSHRVSAVEPSHEPALTRASAQPQKWVAELSSTSRSSGTCRLTSSSEVRYWTLCRLLCCSTRCGAQPQASTGTHRRLIFCPSGFRTE